MQTRPITLDDQMYNVSFTHIFYKPAGDANPQTLENINSTSPMTLSQLYDSLGKVIKKLGNEYGRSQDIDLNKFEDRYDDIAKEVKIVSHLVEDNLGAYNKVILKSGVILQDDWLQCIVCAAALYAAIGGSCALVTACSWGFGIQICSWILAYGLSDYGVDYVCDLLYDCDSLSEPPYEYIGSLITAGATGTGTTLGYPQYVVGEEVFPPFWATMGCTDAGDTVQIVGEMTQNHEEYVHGEILVRAKAPYASDLLIYGSNDYNNWYLIANPTISSSTLTWVDCGYTTLCFNYICLTLYSSNGVDKLVNIDCVKVVP